MQGAAASSCCHAHSLTIHSTDATILEYNREQIVHLSPLRVFTGSDQSTAATV